MFRMQKQIGRFETLLCEISRKLSTVIDLLQLLADQEQEQEISYHVTINEAQQKALQEWYDQEGGADHRP